MPPEDDEIDTEERYSDLVEDETLDYEDGEHTESAHSESVFIVDDEEAGRESFARGSTATLDFAVEAAAFADDVAVDADPNALDAEASASREGTGDVARRHLRGLLEALLFVTDRPMKAADLADVARADTKEVRSILEELSEQYRAESRGFQLDELAGGWQMRTSASYAPFVREITNAKPVKLSRSQVETLAIIAYRQPITRPEIEDIRGVDAGSVLKLLLDRDMIRVLGKKDEPGRPLLYGTTSHFLTFFGLKSLKDLPTLREFTELSDESRETVERELGEVLPEGPREPPPNIVGDASVAAADFDPDMTPPGEPTSHRPPAEVLMPEEAAAAEAANDVESEDKPGGASYDPSDEELFPDDDDSDDDDEDEDEDDEEDGDDDEEEDAEDE
jgi:segregation and condensation protein B